MMTIISHQGMRNIPAVLSMDVHPVEWQRSWCACDSQSASLLSLYFYQARQFTFTSMGCVKCLKVPYIQIKQIQKLYLFFLTTVYFSPKCIILKSWKIKYFNLGNNDKWILNPLCCIFHACCCLCGVCMCVSMCLCIFSNVPNCISMGVLVLSWKKKLEKTQIVGD